MDETQMEETQFRADYKLSDNLQASSGQVFLTGTQALVRLPLMQKALDVAQGWNTAGFISGYRGSPLGMVDQALWKAKKALGEQKIEFLPAINEELGATAVLGSQQIESDPDRTVDGVFAYWYGKGPGVDRAGDALKHGNAYGSSPKGGVLIVAGDDHGCVSSSMPHQSDRAFQAWSVPTVTPASVAEYLEFGLYGWALSRFSGAWVGLTALSEVVESGMTVDLDDTNARVAEWKSADEVRAVSGYAEPADGLHYRWPDLPSLKIEARLEHKLDAVRAFARVNSIDRHIITAPHATRGIITCGKVHYDLIEVLRRLGLSLDELAAAGIRLYKVGLSYPLEAGRMLDFARGLEQILVIEEKAPIVEGQLRELFYNGIDGVRPVISGKQDAHGKTQISSLGELRPSRLIELVANWLAEHSAALDRRQNVTDFMLPSLLSNAGDAVKRVPYFCSGCPHNTSTKVPEGSRAQAGIGCHFMASWMDRETTGLIQMGGEGVDWAAHGRFTKVPHVFQNLGDGTYYHSGYLAIRQSVAAKSNITYKILYNDAVAMTGGQPIDGSISVDQMARQVEAEGVKALAIVSDDISKYAAIKHKFPAYTSFHERGELDQVQRTMREIAGVTVLIYEQTCAAEKRRRRKKGELVDPQKRLFINQSVCEGCGDCGTQSNCLSVLPLETEFGRKRTIDQSSCNKDYSCVNGFCPSFVSVLGGKLRQRSGALRDAGSAGSDALAQYIDQLPQPAAHVWTGPYDMLVTGVGGTGIVTVGALITMAAHLEHKHASVLDFMGFAQKGGSVLSFVRFAQDRVHLNQVRIDTQQADALLACDLVVGASNDALQTVRHGRTRVLANMHEIPVSESIHNPDAELHVDALLEKITHAAGEQQIETLDAQALATQFLGDSIGANILAMGFAWQCGMIPLGLKAMLRAIELNNVAVDMNKMAFNLGRLAAANPQALDQLAGIDAQQQPVSMTLDQLIVHRVAHLTAYQNAAYAQRYVALVEQVRRAEQQAVGQDGELGLTRKVAHNFSKLMSYKDEYEVARLYTDGSFRKQLESQFEGDFTLEFHMAPPVVAKSGANGGAPRKRRFGPWMMSALRVMAKAKGLRGSWLDVFGKTEERRMERALIGAYQSRIQELLPQITPDNLSLAVDIAAIPERIRGYGHIKLDNVSLAKEREAALLHRFDPKRYARPKAGKSVIAGQFKGIPVTSGDAR
ncbi:indolepyruvate ferredoxin oxidoreductase family protein [Undibacterium arcticum]|uniref:Indolepyruvate ferredoxin oxidoreductase family protein n=1 Tax=Undibacterium arcticum TaxID=1762892 RepID=A0ABV7F9D8_9BURK